jgi:hypothetical protein
MLLRDVVDSCAKSTLAYGYEEASLGGVNIILKLGRLLGGSTSPETVGHIAPNGRRHFSSSFYAVPKCKKCLRPCQLRISHRHAVLSRGAPGLAAELEPLGIGVTGLSTRRARRSRPVRGRSASAEREPWEQLYVSTHLHLRAQVEARFATIRATMDKAAAR